MSFWTDEQKMRAAKLWQDGASAGQIAAEFGCSRSSVIGIAHRNRALFPNKPPSAKKPRAPKSGPMARPFVVRKPKVAWPKAPVLPKAEPVEEKPDPDFQPPNPVSILDLTHETCRWPLWPMGDHPGAGGLYCGEAVDGESAWCRHHRLRARAKVVAA